jgi:hypothetical protein
LPWLHFTAQVVEGGWLLVRDDDKGLTAGLREARS